MTWSKSRWDIKCMYIFERFWNMMKKVSMNIYSGSLDTHIHTVNSLSADMQKVMPTCTHVCTRMHLHVYTHTQSSQQTAHGSIRRITVKQTSILTSAAETDYLTFISSGVSSPLCDRLLCISQVRASIYLVLLHWMIGVFNAKLS